MAYPGYVLAVLIGAGFATLMHYLTQGSKEQALCNNNYRRTRPPNKVFNNKGYCSICWDIMDDLMVLVCGHQFHRSCIMEAKAYGKKPRCPVCRNPISD